MSILGIDSLLALNNLYVQGRAEQRSEKSEKLPEHQYRLGLKKNGFSLSETTNSNPGQM